MPTRLARFLSALCVCLLTIAASAAELGKIHLNEYLGATCAPQALHYRLEIPQGRIKDTARCGLRDTANQPVLAQFMPMDTWEDGSIHHLEVSFVSGLNPHERKTYILDDSGQAAQDDGMLQVVTDGDDVVFSSPLMAVKILCCCRDWPRSHHTRQGNRNCGYEKGKHRFVKSCGWAVALDQLQALGQQLLFIVGRYQDGRLHLRQACSLEIVTAIAPADIYRTARQAAKQPLPLPRLLVQRSSRLSLDDRILPVQGSNSNLHTLPRPSSRCCKEWAVSSSRQTTQGSCRQRHT
jgi:hypothetical protein